MRLPFLRSKDPAAERRPRAAPADDAAAVEAARTRARRRLIGAGVLLLAGVIGFPLLFETQPRPLPADTPIEVRPRGQAAVPKPAALPAPRLPALPPDAGSEVSAAGMPAAPGAAQDGDAAAPGDAPRAAPTPPTAASMAPPAAARVAAAVERSASAALPTPARPMPATPSVDPAPAARTASASPNVRPDDGARARALLEGSAPASAAAPASRFVVQVGAFGDATALRQARQRVEKMGLQTYTQVVDTADGKRTRVRVGPYASRAEADAAAARLKGAGLPAAILAL